MNVVVCSGAAMSVTAATNYSVAATEVAVLGRVIKIACVVVSVMTAALALTLLWFC